MQPRYQSLFESILNEAEGGSGATAAQRAGPIRKGTAGGDTVASGLANRASTSASAIVRAATRRASTPINRDQVARAIGGLRSAQGSTGTATRNQIYRAGTVSRGRSQMNRGQKASADRYSAQARASGKPTSVQPNRPGTNIVVNNSNANYISSKTAMDNAAEKRRIHQKQITKSGNAASNFNRNRSADSANDRAAASARSERQRKERSAADKQANSIAQSLLFNMDRGRQSQADLKAHSDRAARTKQQTMQRGSQGQSASQVRAGAASAARAGDKSRSGGTPPVPATRNTGIMRNLRRGVENAPNNAARNQAVSTAAQRAGISGNQNQTQTSSARTHTIAKGDNPSTIAKKYGMTLAQLYAANPTLKGNERRLQIGQSLSLGKGSGSSSSATSSTTARVAASRPQPSPTQSYDDMSFGAAFSAARKAHGGNGGTFTWRGKRFTTNR